MILFLAYFILLLIICMMNKSVATFFVLIQIVSLIGTLFIGVDYPIDKFLTFFNLMFTAVILTLIILPWIRIRNINKIHHTNEVKLKKLTKYLILISIIPFILFAVVATFVFLYVDDIEIFKYAEDVSTEFYYSLPINTTALILSSFVYYVSYFLIPLHFYYLSKRRFQLSFWSFLFSLNIILMGLTFFSRAVFVHYILIYIGFLILLYRTFDSKVRRFINLASIIIGISFTSYFIYITNQRFAENEGYSNLVPKEALIQNPATYSYFDYLSQWYSNNLHVLDNYQFETFKGQISLQTPLLLLGQYGFIDYPANTLISTRQRLWPQHWYTFNGFVAYSVYDYGYILTIIFCSVYAFVIIRLRPKNNTISIINLFYLVLLIQVPLMAIFYSSVGGMLFPAFFLIPIYIYLKIKWK